MRMKFQSKFNYKVFHLALFAELSLSLWHPSSLIHPLMGDVIACQMKLQAFQLQFERAQLLIAFRRFISLTHLLFVCLWPV